MTSRFTGKFSTVPGRRSFWLSASKEATGVEKEHANGPLFAVVPT